MQNAFVLTCNYVLQSQQVYCFHFRPSHLTGSFADRSCQHGVFLTLPIFSNGDRKTNKISIVLQIGARGMESNAPNNKRPLSTCSCALLAICIRETLLWSQGHLFLPLCFAALYVACWIKLSTLQTMIQNSKQLALRSTLNSLSVIICVNSIEIMGHVWTWRCNLLLEDKRVKRIRIFWASPFFFVNWLFLCYFSCSCIVLITAHSRQNCTYMYWYVNRALMRNV